MLAALILAAGESRRMGSPKALLALGDKTFVDHLLQVTRHPQITIQRVVLGANAEFIRESLSLPNEMLVVNPEWELGQLSSIQAGVRAIEASSNEGVMICPVDHPLVSASLVGELVAAFLLEGAKKGIVLPTYRGKRGHPVIFARRFYDALLEAPQDEGARAVVWENSGEVNEIETTEEGIVLNLNDPETYRNAMK
jgi:molybdenum cofactor cytidylyltransferase